MSNNFKLPFSSEPWTRRQVLQLGLCSSLVAGAGSLWHLTNSSRSRAKIPPTGIDNIPGAAQPMKTLREFDYGTIKQENGRTVREFQLIAGTSVVQLNNAVAHNIWDLNNRIPGPTLRAKEGDRIRVVFLNRAGHSHSLHFHGIHPATMDGVKPVKHDSVTIYEFDAEPYGLHLYHCHISPVTRHIAKGLYGMFIIDPPNPRPPADEIVLVMAGYDINDNSHNEYYAFNGLPDYYVNHPISIYQDQLVRVYLLNIIEYDPAVTFHLHANFFDVYRSGMTITPSEKTDVITMGVAERHILEFSFHYPGRYMFHPHQDTIAEKGCMGEFQVIPHNTG